MKRKIKEWLGINLLEINASQDLVKIAELKAKITSLEIDLSENRKNYQYMSMCIKGMMEHLDLEWFREEILDPRVLYTPATIPIIRFKKRKK